MSAGRRMRQQMKRRHLAESLNAAASERARYQGDVGPYELWQRGPVMFLVPKVPLGAPDEVAGAISRRRLASITGECECGAGYRLHRGRLEMAHEHDCPASDSAMAEVLERHGWTAQYLGGDAA